MIGFILLGASAVLGALKVAGKGPTAGWAWWKVAAPGAAYVAYYVLTTYLMSSGTV